MDHEILQEVTELVRKQQGGRGAMLEWAWCQYVWKQTCFDLATFGGAKAK